MATKDLTQVLNSMTPAERDIVYEFALFLKARESTPSSPFLAAVDEFIEQHPELLRRLAQ